MTVLKRRTRMVNFRLSEDEYADLKSLCIGKGARSISDFTREAVCSLVSTNNHGTADRAEPTVQELRGKFEELDREVKRLAQLLEGVPAAARTRKAERSNGSLSAAAGSAND
jgi:hypothetical protein